MKRTCQDINLRDVDSVYPYVCDCINRHYKRHDFRRLLKVTGGLGKDDFLALENGDKTPLRKGALNVAREAVRQITNRKLMLPPCTVRRRIDQTTGKERLIGNESAMQQCLDYIAVGASESVWKRRIVPQQASSIKGRGQVYGVRMISKWFVSDKRSAALARKHGTRYSNRCRFHVKTDVRKCFGSLRVDVFMRHFRRDCKNGDLLWLWENLLKSYRVPVIGGGIYEGFLIGALPSQWACQYLLSFAYRFAKGLHAERRGRKTRLVSRMVMFMDDFEMFSSARKHLKTAVRELAAFIKTELGLDLKMDWQILRAEESPVDMMGYRIHADGNMNARRRVFIHARRIVLRVLRCGCICPRRAKRIASYKGYFTHTKRNALPVKAFTARARLRLRRMFHVSARAVGSGRMVPCTN